MGQKPDVELFLNTLSKKELQELRIFLRDAKADMYESDSVPEGLYREYSYDPKAYLVVYDHACSCWQAFLQDYASFEHRAQIDRDWAAKTRNFTAKSWLGEVANICSVCMSYTGTSNG